MSSVKVIIGGDLLPSTKNIGQFEEGNLDILLGKKLQNYLKNADIRVFNLEGPITNANTRIKKDAPNLRASPSCLNGIRLINPTVLSLANNHIRDYGEKGILDTLDFLSAEGIATVGCGDLKSAQEPYVISHNDIKIAIVSVAEHEFSFASESELGANPFDIQKCCATIASVRNKVDYIIVLFHGGKEKYRYPTPIEMKNLHSICLARPDLIIAQHSHCVGCFEKFGNTTIVYGQGNFHFCREKNEFYDTALLCEIEISKDNTVSSSNITWTPIEMVGNDSVKLSNSDSAKDILLGFQLRSNNIKKPEFVKNEYRKYCVFLRYNFEKQLLGRGIDGLIYRLLSKLSLKVAHKFFLCIYREDIPGLLNSYRCETHQEIMIQILKDCYDEMIL